MNAVDINNVSEIRELLRRLNIQTASLALQTVALPERPTLLERPTRYDFVIPCLCMAAAIGAGFVIGSL